MRAFKDTKSHPGNEASTTQDRLKEVNSSGAEVCDNLESDEKIRKDIFKILEKDDNYIYTKNICETIRKKISTVADIQLSINILIREFEKRAVEFLNKRGINAEYVPDYTNFREDMSWANESRIAIPGKKFTEAQEIVAIILKKEGIENFRLTPQSNLEPMGCSIEQY